jgi:cell division protein FtsQ
MSSKKNSKKLSGSKRQLKILIDKIRFWVVIIFCLSFLVLAAFGKIQQGWNSFKNLLYNYSASHGYKFNNLVISSIKNAPKTAVAAAVQVKAGTPLLAIDLDAIKERVKKNEWVKAAIVERRFPDTIYIGILERKPIAIWQTNYKMNLIDDEGFVIPVESISSFSHLLLVVGSDAPIYTKKLIDDLNTNPKLAKEVLSATRYGERRWNLMLKENITVKMPETDFKRAWNYLNKLYAQDKLFGQNYKTLDLRDHQKYYVEKY